MTFLPRMVFVSLMLIAVVAGHPWLLAALLVLGGIGGAFVWNLRSVQPRERDQQQASPEYA